MPSIDEVCQALADVVSNVSGLRAKAHPDDQINPPEAQIFTQDFDPRMVFSDSVSTYKLGVRVVVPRTNLRTAYKLLRDYMAVEGDSSIRAVIEDGDLWAEEIDYACVTLIGQPFELPLNENTYMAVDFDVDVVW